MDYEIAISITELSQVNIVTFFEMETLELRNNMCKQYRQVRFIFFGGGAVSDFYASFTFMLPSISDLTSLFSISNSIY